MKVSEYVDGIRGKAYLLPEFQREYVWSKEQSKQLIVSMFKRYPVGSILIWNTSNPPEVKNFEIEPDGRPYKLILDGQQRLTTLFIFITGEIPPYYTKSDISNNPADLFIHLVKGEFQYYQKQLMHNDPVWQPVVDCLIDLEVNPYRIIEECEANGKVIENKLELSNIIYENLTRLRNIKEIDFPELTVPSTALIDDAIDVFDRVNSLGTKLTESELVLTHITGKWPAARREMKKAIQQYEKSNMRLSLSFLTRCIIVELTKSASLKDIDYSKFSQEQLINAWGKVKKSCDYLLPILQNATKIHDTADISTNNLLIPIIAYLLVNGNVFDEKAKNGFIYWLFVAMIWQRYSSQTDQKLDKDVQICLKESRPIRALIDEIIEMRGRIEVKASDLEGRGAGHPLYRMFFILTKNINAIDFSNGSYIGNTIGDYYSIQSHHLFPRAFLQRNGYDTTNVIHSKKINEIANRAFITRDTNYTLGIRSPDSYLLEVIDRYPSALDDHFIPKNKEFWKIEHYELFLEERRKLIAEGINTFLQSFLDKYEGLASNGFESYIERIRGGEDSFTEFKATLQYSINSGKYEKYIEYAIAKTICGFLNSGGGRLFIGVDDNGNIVGLDNDFSLYRKGNARDEFGLRFDNIIRDYIGSENSVYLHHEFITVDGKDVFVVTVSPSNTPCFMRSMEKGKEEFFIRQTVSTQPLSISQVAEYISTRFEN